MLTERLIALGARAEFAVANATDALIEREAELARQVIAEHAGAVELKEDIDRMCLAMLERPGSPDLRVLTSVMRIGADIERVWHNAVHIARRTLDILHEPGTGAILDLRLGAAAARNLLRKSLDAFLQRNVQIAQSVMDDNAYISAVSDQLMRKLLTYMLSDRGNTEGSLGAIFAARNLERVGDHAVSIAETTLLLAGQDIRDSHARGQKTIVLRQQFPRIEGATLSPWEARTRTHKPL
jgi:phosphate transport system protein